MEAKNSKLQPLGRLNNFSSGTAQQDDDLKRIQGRYSPGVVLLITIIGIAVAEIFAMIVVYYQRHLPYYQQVLLDAAVMTVIIFPLLYFLSFRPIFQHVQQRYRVERILQSRLRMIQFANTHTLDELLRFVLDEIEALTASAIGFIHFIDPDQNSLSHQTWSTNTLQSACSMPAAEGHFPVDLGGTWADCVRQKKHVIHNDYGSLSQPGDLPDGHAALIRDLAVPIIRNERVVAIFGVGNKPHKYEESDVELVSTLSDFAWDIVKRKQAGDELRDSEEKFRTLVTWTYDWELWLDPTGNIVYTSPSCQRMTAYSPQEFIDNPELLMKIIHPDDLDFYMKHHQLIHDASAGMEKVEYRIMTRDGAEHWVEHVCRPLFDTDEQYLGRRVSNRDITERKRTEREIAERNQKEQKLAQTIHTMQLDIARDLHDTIGQHIGFLRMKLDYLSGKKSVKRSDMQTELESMTRVANESYDLIRGTLAVLQTTDSSDLFRVFSRYASQIEERSAIRVEFSSEGKPKSLSAKRMRQLFYIFREALSNIEKHAEARQVSIKIGWGQSHLDLAVSDDGKGFDPLNIQYGSHYGLRFMRERVELLNGSLDIQSAPDTGTELVVRVPYE